MKYTLYILVLSLFSTACVSSNRIKKGVAEYHLPDNSKVEVVVSKIETRPVEAGKNFRVHNISCYIHNGSNRELHDSMCRISVNLKNGKKITRSISFATLNPRSKSKIRTRTFLIPIESPITTIDPQLFYYSYDKNKNRVNIEPLRLKY